MSKFSLDDYVDVAERIAQFSARYPEGSLQGSGTFVTEPVVGYLYRAQAYRTPDDERPGIGTAFEPIPGKTPYTRDSEVQNAETAAWGRAIVALGFETKKIASKQEVKARHESGAGERKPAAGAGNRPAPEKLVPDEKVPDAKMETLTQGINALCDVTGKQAPEVVREIVAEHGDGWNKSEIAVDLVTAWLRRKWREESEKAA